MERVGMRVEWMRTGTGREGQMERQAAGKLAAGRRDTGGWLAWAWTGSGTLAGLAWLAAVAMIGGLSGCCCAGPSVPSAPSAELARTLDEAAFKYHLDSLGHPRPCQEILEAARRLQGAQAAVAERLGDSPDLRLLRGLRQAREELLGLPCRQEL